jgi:hypothetical protein
MAAAAIQIGMQLGNSILGGLLAGHLQRLKDAKSENEALDNAVPTFDQSIQSIIQYYNAGEITAQAAASAIMQLDGQIKTYFQGLSAKNLPGIAWTEYSSPAALPCGKACTATCCVYWTMIHPTCIALSAYLSGQSLPASYVGWGVNFAKQNRISGNVTWTVIAINANQYSTYTRPSYQLSVLAPGAQSQITSGSSPIAGIEGAFASVQDALGFSNSSTVSFAPSTTSGSVLAQSHPNSILKYFVLGLIVLGAFLFLRSR